MITLIRGGTVYDGTGDAPREADVLIHGGVIARIGARLNVRAQEIVEARGALVTPGFVDIANYTDHYRTLFSDPAGTEPLIRGITSLVVGHGGASLAPLSRHGGSPEGWWGNPTTPIAHSADLHEFLSLLKGRMGVNIGTLVGYSTVRERILRGAGRDLTDPEFEHLEAALARALDDGALGVSLNLEHVSAAHLPHYEICAAARAAARVNGIFALRLRDREAELNTSFTEALAVSEATHANLLVTDLEPYARERDRYRALLSQITRGSAEHNVHVTTSGSGAAGIPLPLLLPPHFRESSWEEMRARLSAPATRDELRAYLARYRDVAFHIGAVADPSLKLFEGTSFAKWSLHEHHSFEDALLRLMEVTNLRALLVAEIGEDALTRSFAHHDRAFIASGETSTPCLESSPHLAFLAADHDEALSREQRVARMTGGPAKKLGLVRRGFLREGFHADILVIDPASPQRGEAKKYAVREALVNGIRAIRKGAPTGERGGAVLTRA